MQTEIETSAIQSRDANDETRDGHGKGQAGPAAKL